MSFYKLWFDEQSNSWLPVIDEEKLVATKRDIWTYSRCEWCSDVEPVPCRIDSPGCPVDFNRDPLTSAPIVSRRLAELLQELAPGDIQIIPASLDAAGEWAIVNVLPLVDAIDFEQSVMTFHDESAPVRAGKPSGVMRLIVDPEKAGTHQLFRLTDWRIAIVVSEMIKQECQKRVMTDMKFIPATVSNWTRYIKNPASEEWCRRH